MFFIKLHHYILFFICNTWEQRKLGEIVDICSGRDYKHLEEGDIPVYGTGGYMLSVSEALSNEKDAIGIGRKGTIDKPYILKAPFWTVDTLFYCIPREKYHLDFTYDIFQNIDWRLMDESTGVPSLSKTAINAVNVLVPNEEEQLKIGEYFRTLDHLITLHQRKYFIIYNKLITWEQRKLSDEVSSIDTGKSKFDTKESGDYEILGSTGVIGYDDSFDYEGDFLLTARVGANAGTLYRHSGKVKITDNTVFLHGSHIDFVFYLLDKFDLKKMSFGSGQPLIKASELKCLELMMPVQNEEKEKIATYFLNLDHLITLHRRAL